MPKAIGPAATAAGDSLAPVCGSLTSPTAVLTELAEPIPLPAALVKPAPLRVGVPGVIGSLGVLARPELSWPAFG